MKRLLLEDYIEDIGLDKLEDEVDGVTLEELRQAFPYYVTVCVLWERTFENPNIPLKRIEDNIENMMAMVRLFSDDPILERVTIKSDVNRANQPEPLVFGSANMPDVVDGRLVLINDHYRDSYHRVNIIYKFIFKGLRKCSFDRFSAKIRNLMSVFRKVSPGKSDCVTMTFYRNEGAETPYEERISLPRERNLRYDTRHFSTNYVHMSDNLALIYNALIKDEDIEEITEEESKEAMKLGIYRETSFPKIVSDAVKKAKEYGLKVKFGRMTGPSAEQFAKSTEDQVFALPFTVDSASTDPIDVEQIEKWIISEIVFRINIDFVDLANFCFPLKCLCKVTDKQMDEIVRAYREEHPNYPRMEHKYKNYHYFKGSKRHIVTLECETYNNKYVWRARVGEYSNISRTDFAILIGDNKGRLTKNMENITYPMSPWNDVIKEMREPDTKLFK